jgi:hypothetical protein
MRLLRCLTLLALAAPSVAAQARLVRDAEVRATPEGNIVATLESGTTWRTGPARGGFTQLTIEAWIDGSRFAGRREEFPESIGGTGTLRIRAEPSLNGRILGVFEAGAGVRVLERSGTWARISRDAWILTSAIRTATVADNPASAPPRTTPRPPATTPATTPAVAPVPPAQRQPPTADPVHADSSPAPSRPARSGDLRALRATELSRAPGAEAVARIEAGAVVEPIARDRGWVRVRVEAWVPESLMVPTDTAYRDLVTAADLRLDPAAYRGRTVRWIVQIVALQAADPLRRDLEPEEPYLLAMGPKGESAVLYLAVPPSLLAQAKSIAPMAEVLITARVRTARSMPTGAPVLDLLTLTKR